MVLAPSNEVTFEYVVCDGALSGLGLFDNQGRFDVKAANLARKFIWKDLSVEPDYMTLKEHLSTYVINRKKVKSTLKSKTKQSSRKLVQKQKKKARKKNGKRK